MKDITKIEFRVLYEAIVKNPWLNDKYNALEQLLFSECKTGSQRELVLALIHRFKYLSRENYRECLRFMVEDIVTDPDLNESDTQIVAMAAGSKPDSSQHIIYDIKTVLEEYKWREHALVTNYINSYKTYKRDNSYKNIVLVDEFVGTGDTVINRMKDISRLFQEKSICDYSIKVRVIAAMEFGLDAVRSKGVDIQALNVLKKGISDYYSAQDVVEKILEMCELESVLSTEYNGKEMPSLGYGESESLYCRDDGNTPNSVFPIFWWPLYADESNRDTLLIRAMSDA